VQLRWLTDPRTAIITAGPDRADQAKIWCTERSFMEWRSKPVRLTTRAG
jgi:hypothetical protein